MRVAMITQAFHPRVGGAERQLLAVAPLLQEHGVEVHVVTRRYRGTDREAVVDGIPVHRLGHEGAGTGSLVFTGAAQLLLRRLRPHVLHAYELLSPTTTALIAGLHLPAPLVVKVLGGAELDLLRARPAGGRRLRVAATRVDRFQVVSDEIDAGLAALGVPRHRRARIGNGVDVQRFHGATTQQRALARRSLGLPVTAGPVVACIGRLSPEKGVADLQAAWPRVLARHPEARLLLAGGGPTAVDLARTAPPQVRQLGVVHDVVELLRAVDLLVLPSHAEGVPNVVLEAMAAEVPCVVTGVGGSVELADGGRRALSVPPRRPDELAAAVLEALEQPEAARARALRAREHVVRERSLDATATRLVALYEELHGGYVGERPRHRVSGPRLAGSGM